MPLHVALLLLGLSVAPRQSDALNAPAIAAPIDAAPFTHVVFGAPAASVDDPPPPASDDAGRVLSDPPRDVGRVLSDPPRDVGRVLSDPPRDQQKPPDKADEKKPPTPPHTGVHALFEGLWGDVKHLPSKENAYIALVGGAAALAVHPLDDDVNAHLQAHYGVAHTIWEPAKWVGESPVQVGAAIVVYILGRVNDQPKVSHFGMDWIRALIVQEVITDTLKFATQRERPDHSDSLSFPSGHSSTTFATATVIERHLGWKYAALGYTLAAYVASSRLHENKHWLSDVVFGAAVGTISGRTVTQHGRNVWTFAPVTVPGGVAVVVARTGS